MRRYRTVLLLAGLILACALYIFHDRSAATTDALEARRRNLFPGFQRERVDQIDVSVGTGAWTLRRHGDDWVVSTGGNGRKADAVEVERMLSEIEGAEPSRRLGVMDAATRARLGFGSPRARVTVHEGPRVTARFDIGSAVSDEDSAYVTSDGHAVVLPKSFAEAFARTASDLRDKTVVELDPARINSLVISVRGAVTRIERRGPVWRVLQPDIGRAARGAVDAITSELHTLNATRWLSDDTSTATLAQYGLESPAVRVEVGRAGGASVVLRFGTACPGHDGEYTATREGSSSVFCVGRALLDAVNVSADSFRDEHVLAARTDEVARVHIHGPGAVDFAFHRTSDGWTGDTPGLAMDTESVESWLNALHDLTAAARLSGDTRSAHGLMPARETLEVSRTGVDGVETLHVGSADATGLYVTRDDESVVLQFAPSAAETLVVDAVRFRPRRLVRDSEDDLQAVLIDAGALHEELTRTAGTWRLARPVQAAADGGLVRDLARTLANLDVDRWVSPSPRPEYGLAVPRARIIARFEGPGARDPDDAGAGADGGPRVRTYTLALGAQAPGGGVYGTLEGTSGVFVLPRAVMDTLSQPHIDRGALAVPREDVQRVTLTGPGTRRVVIVRSGALWRTENGAPADADRVSDVLDRLAAATAPRAFGYGPAPADAHLGDSAVELTLATDAGTSSVRITLGDRFGVGDSAGYYARRDGLDATLSLTVELVDALQEFRP